MWISSTVVIMMLVFSLLSSDFLLVEVLLLKVKVTSFTS